MSNRASRIAIWIGSLTMMATVSLFAGTISPSSSLPPNNGSYVANVDACYNLPAPLSTTACLQNGSVGNFLNASSNFASSPGNQIATFDTTLTASLLIFGSSQGPYQFTGAATVEVFNRNSQSDTGTFQTEMLAMDLSGNIPGLGPLMIRESPTLASTGQTSVTPIAATRPLFQIDSFFDVFTEISLDGGRTWTPGGPTTVNLQNAPEPATWFLLGTSLAALSAFRLRRRR